MIAIGCFATTPPSLLAQSQVLPAIGITHDIPCTSSPRTQFSRVYRSRGGPPVQGAEEDIPLVARFDRNSDKLLDHDERRRRASTWRRIRSCDGRCAVAGSRASAVRAAALRADVKIYPGTVPLYDPGALRTFFLEFEHPDWEQELEAFWHTDVEVPATLRVDGKTYRDVGVSFRGNNSFTAVPAGLKRPFSLTMDFVHDQDLLGHTSLNLLNANQDPTFLRSSLYLDVARDYIPAPKANFVRVVINGESWGIYVNQQTFSKEFLRERSRRHERHALEVAEQLRRRRILVPGDDIALYRRWYEMKGKDDHRGVADADPCDRGAERDAGRSARSRRWRRSWTWTQCCDSSRSMSRWSTGWLLADGSDFNLYLRPDGPILAAAARCERGIPHRRPRRCGGAQPDPLATLDDTNKALRHKLLAVPALRDAIPRLRRRHRREMARLAAARPIGRAVSRADRRRRRARYAEARHDGGVSDRHLSARRRTPAPVTARSRDSRICGGRRCWRTPRS